MQPKYISGLLNSAATRRLDYLRAEEKMIQREREMEGDEFKDKDAFVTQAYKDQKYERRKKRKGSEMVRRSGDQAFSISERWAYFQSLRSERKAVHQRG
jgi:coiled-coil domain-containing protein 55